MVQHFTIAISSKQRSHWIDITRAVQQKLDHAGITDGICTIASVHTTAGLTINENADPDVGRDFFWKLNQLLPQQDNYHHREGNSDSHLKASLVGFSAQVPVKNSNLVLGTWQSIYFCEFDGPRNRTVHLTIIGE